MVVPFIVLFIINFFGSLAIVWNDRGEGGQAVKSIITLIILTAIMAGILGFMQTMIPAEGH